MSEQRRIPGRRLLVGAPGHRDGIQAALALWRSWRGIRATALRLVG